MQLLRHTLFCFAIVLMLMPSYGTAQHLPPSWLDYIDAQALDDDESLDAFFMELSDLYTSLVVNPINLNDTSSSRLAALPFVGQQRQRILCAYIEQMGPLYSVDELLLVHGFSSHLVEMLRDVVVALPIEQHDTLSLHDMLRRGRGQLLLGTSRIAERNRGTQQHKYDGDPYRLYGRATYCYDDKIRLSLSADKDPGEALFYGHQQRGFDHYSGYLALGNMGIVRQAVVGHYNLQFGQGLTLWTGFAPYSSMLTDDFRSPRGVVPASPFVEYGNQQGVATTLQIHPTLHFSTFYSNIGIDATLNADDTITSLSSSGYHRTESELSRRHAAREQLYGMHLQYGTSSLEVGATWVGSHLSAPFAPSATLYSHYTVGRKDEMHAGVDVRYRHRLFMAFGEATVSQQGAMAALAGISFLISPDRMLGITLHHYPASFYNRYAAAPSIFSGNTNEQGVRLSLQSPLPLHLLLRMEADAYRHDAMRYGIYGPSQGALIRMSLMRPFSAKTSLQMLFSDRLYGANAMPDTMAQYVVDQQSRRMLRFTLTTSSGAWRWRTIMACSWFDADLDADARGFVLGEDITFSPSLFPMQVQGSIALFDVANYDARITMSEGGLAYQRSSQMLYGRGLRLYAVARYAITQDLHLSAKYALTTMTDVESIGSGLEQTNGDHRQQIFVQLRYSFAPSSRGNVMRDDDDNR